MIPHCIVSVDDPEKVDPLIVSQLAKTGNQIEIREWCRLSDEDLSEASIVIVLSTHSSPLLRDTEIPVLICKLAPLYEIGMIGGSPDYDFGTYKKESSAATAELPVLGLDTEQCSDSSWPIAVGDIWAKPEESAVVFLKGSQADDTSTVFGYYEQAPMSRSAVAPGRRAAFLHGQQSAELLTHDQWRLFRMVVKWLIGGQRHAEKLQGKPSPMMSDREYFDWVYQQVASKVTGNLFRIWSAIGGVVVVVLGSLGSFLINSSVSSKVSSEVKPLVLGEVGHILASNQRVEETLQTNAVNAVVRKANEAAEKRLAEELKEDRIVSRIENALQGKGILLSVLTERAIQDFSKSRPGTHARHQLLRDIGNFGRGASNAMHFLVETISSSEDPRERKLALLAFSRPHEAVETNLQSYLESGLNRMKQENVWDEELQRAYENFLSTFGESEIGVLAESLSGNIHHSSEGLECLVNSMTSISSSRALEIFQTIIGDHRITTNTATAIWGAIGRIDIDAVDRSGNSRINALRGIWSPIERSLRNLENVTAIESEHTSMSSELGVRRRRLAQYLIAVARYVETGLVSRSDPVFSQDLGSSVLKRYLSRLRDNVREPSEAPLRVFRDRMFHNAVYDEISSNVSIPIGPGTFDSRARAFGNLLRGSEDEWGYIKNNLWPNDSKTSESGMRVLENLCLVWGDKLKKRKMSDLSDALMHEIGVHPGALRSWALSRVIVDVLPSCSVPVARRFVSECLESGLDGAGDGRPFHGAYPLEIALRRLGASAPDLSAVENLLTKLDREVGASRYANRIVMEEVLTVTADHWVKSRNVPLDGDAVKISNLLNGRNSIGRRGGAQSPALQLAVERLGRYAEQDPSVTVKAALYVILLHTYGVILHDRTDDDLLITSGARLRLSKLLEGIGASDVRELAQDVLDEVNRRLSWRGNIENITELTDDFSYVVTPRSVSDKWFKADKGAIWRIAATNCSFVCEIVHEDKNQILESVVPRGGGGVRVSLSDESGAGYMRVRSVTKADSAKLVMTRQNKILSADSREKAGELNAISFSGNYEGFIDFPNGKERTRWLRIAGKSGRVYTVESRDLDGTSRIRDGDPAMTVYLNDQVIAQDDDGGVGWNARVEWKASEDADFLVQVRLRGVLGTRSAATLGLALRDGTKL